MIALLALLALLAAPPLMWIPSRRLARRAAAAGVKAGDRAGGKALVRPGEAAAVFTGLLLAAAGLLTLATLAVLG